MPRIDEITSDKKSYFKSILTLLTGSMAAQLFTVICSPILTRICTAEDLGTYSLITGAITIFGMVMSLRYEVCMVSEPNERKAFGLAKLSFYICGGMSCIVFLIYSLYFFTRSFGTNPFILSLITATLVFLLGIVNIVTAYNNRHKEYSLITKTYVARMFCQNAGNLIAGFLHFGAIGLALSQLIGYFVGVHAQAYPLLQHRKEIADISSQDIKEIALDNKKQPLLSAPAVFANGLSYTLINYFIEALFSTTVVGYYSISYRILGLPLTLISGNVSKVFLERAACEFQNEGNFKKTYSSTLKLMLAMAVPMAVLLMIFAPWLCEVGLGKGWHVAGEYIRILAPMMALRFVAGGVNCAAIIVNRQQYDFIIQISLTVTAITIFIFSSMLSLKIDAFLILLSVAFSMIYLVYIVLFWKCAKGDAL